MSFGFLQTTMLLGLAGLAIPVLIHLWNRRRPEVIDWGAMQFLELNPARRRRLVVEELLLLTARLALVALLVAGLAAPFARGPLLAAWTDPPREVVFVLDASASMARTDLSPAPWVRALDAVRAEIEALRPGDRFGLVLANRPVRPIREGLHRPANAAELLAGLDAPAGSADGPAACAIAEKLLGDHGQASRREIVFVTDGQKEGWADPASNLRWEQMSRSESAEQPRSARRAIVVGSDPPAAAPNFAVASIEASRRVAAVGQRVRFTATIETPVGGPLPPRLRAFVDDELVHEWAADDLPQAKTGRGQVQFEHTFRRAGPQAISVVLDVPERDGKPLDAFPADQRRDVVIEVVPEVPVLLVDGTTEAGPGSPTFYLMQAFADPAEKLRPSPITPRRIPVDRLSAQMLTDTRPRAVVLADVASLTSSQAEAIDHYLKDGGAALVLLGPHADPETYNEALYRGGKGWLPCRLEELASAPKGEPATLDTSRLLHPALALFRSRDKNQLAELALRRWWRVSTERHGGTAISAILSSGDPWLVEKSVGQGRVLVSTLPFDRSWDNVLANTWEFPVLAHELVFSLTDLGSQRYNLTPGHPLRVGPDTFAPSWRPPSLPVPAVIHRPGGGTTATLVANWPGLLEAPGPAGRYRIAIGDRPAFPVAVEDDARESDLTPLSADDRRRLSDLAGIAWDPSAATAGESDAALDLWRWFFAALLVVLVLESWLARRIQAA